MGAADPTYPLYPISCIVAAAMLLLVLLTSFVRQNWNLGVTFLCFWLFLLNLTNAVNAIIWSDNADPEHFVYCDIVTHVQVITNVVNPMSTLIITRRLYLIASLQSVDLPSKAARRRNLVVEWTLGLCIPLLIAGPIYYIHQYTRFAIDEGFGCANAPVISILELLTIEIWNVIPPLISVLFFYPKIIRIFYRQSRDIQSFLGSNGSVSRTNYLRILALASVDILLTLPIGIVSIALDINLPLSVIHVLPFYQGWAIIHANWEPDITLYATVKDQGAAALSPYYFLRWTSTVLAFIIFGLFGLTEARASYWHIIHTLGSWVGWKSTSHARKGPHSLGEVEFGARLGHDGSLGDIELGAGASRSSRPSFVAIEVPVVSHDAENILDESVTRKSSIKEVRQSVNEADLGEHEHRVPVNRASACAAVDL